MLYLVEGGGRVVGGEVGTVYDICLSCGSCCTIGGEASR